MTREFNEAKQLYMEQYGSALVEKSYLKLALLIVSMIALMLIGLNMRTQNMVKNFKPLVIRIDDIGRAERINYQSFEYKPQELEIKYFLNQFVTLYYSRHASTFHKDFTDSLYFLESKLASAIMDSYEKSQSQDTFLSDRQALNIEAKVKNIILSEFETPPFKAQIDFEKIHKTRLEGKEILRETMTGTFIFDFTDSVENEQALINPLGLTITWFRDDKAFR